MQYPLQGGQQQPPKKWYRSSFWIIVFLIFIFPLGLYLMWRYATWSKKAKWVITGVLVVCVVLIGSTNGSTPQAKTEAIVPTHVPQIVATQAPLPTSQPTTTPQPTATPLIVSYPPKTEADLRGLATKGDATVLSEFDSESVGMTGVCPQPKREVTVDPAITGQHLAQDLLAYFYAQRLDSPCGSIVFVYHTQAEASDIYTAGRIKLDVTDSSGASNFDPNATNVTYTLTLDIGGGYTPQEYIVTYSS